MSSPPTDSRVRLQKVLASAGLGSRRACEELIAAGRVSVNGRVVELGARVDPALDVVRVDGDRLPTAAGLVYLALHKPQGMHSTMSDPQGRPCIGDLVRERGDGEGTAGLHHVGRLDADSEGLLLLTDDGRLQARIADPRFKAAKSYLVQVEGEPDGAALEALRRGVRLKDGMTLPAEVERIEAPALWPRDPPVRFRKTVADCWISLTLREGRNRQVRRMTAAVGHPTLRLVRWRIGEWTVEGLAPGEWRDVSF